MLWKKAGQIEGTNEMVDIKTNMSVFTINGNGLNIPGKTVGLS